MLASIVRCIHDTFFGWTLIGEIPKVKKALVFSYPHTSYWDGFYSILISYALNGYLIFKSDADSWVYMVANYLGHITVDRNKESNQTQIISDIIDKKEKIWLMISPEGSCKKMKYLRTGFYYIALKSNIPIICANYNYYKSEYQFSKPIYVKEIQDDTEIYTKTIDEVFDEVKHFYYSNNLIRTGKFPKKETPLEIKYKDY